MALYSPIHGIKLHFLIFWLNKAYIKPCVIISSTGRGFACYVGNSDAVCFCTSKAVSS